MVSLTFMVFLAVQACSSFSETRALPRGFAVFLEKIGISLEEYLDSTMNDQDSAISTTQNDVTTRLRDSSDTPEHSSGVNTVKLNNIPFTPGDAFCGLRPTAVAIPRHPGVKIFPNHVILQRCTGSCLFTPDSQHCAVTHQNEVTIRIFESLGGSGLWKNIKVYNHTACACDCIKKPSDCDPVKHVWHAGSCACTCKSDGSECDSSKQRWIQGTCECQCSSAPIVCDHSKEWDRTNCGCHCKKKLQDYCKSKNLNIDPNTCKCVNPGVEVL